MKKIGIVSLGCAKNLVDSEIILASFVNEKYAITNDPKDADVIVVNTCAFIKEAKQESIDTILEMARYNKKLIVTGCLAERYVNELKESLPEAKFLIPFSRYHHFKKYLNQYLRDKKNYCFNPLSRIISTSPGTAYLRIAEGCNNFCAFCAIPYIRGRYHSRSIKEIVNEAKILANKGIKELTIIAQDVSYYGYDLKDGSNLIKLLNSLEKISKIKHIRLLYLYPSEITNEFINYIKNSKKVYPYFDVPLQHASDKILLAMHRKGKQRDTLNLLKKIRQLIPNAIIRSTFIVGFPNETMQDYQKLYHFIRDFRFDHVGIFAYSKEEGTRAATYPHQINEKTKLFRRDKLFNLQKTISYQKNLNHIGEIIDGICVSHDVNTNRYTFLTRFNAPDDVDGSVFTINKTPLKLGKYYRLKVKDAFVYDLLVEIIS